MIVQLLDVQAEQKVKLTSVDRSRFFPYPEILTVRVQLYTVGIPMRMYFADFDITYSTRETRPTRRARASSAIYRGYIVTAGSTHTDRPWREREPEDGDRRGPVGTIPLACIE